MKYRYLLSLIFLMFFHLGFGQDNTSTVSETEVNLPSSVISGIPFEVTLSNDQWQKGTQEVRVNDESHSVQVENGQGTLSLTLDRSTELNFQIGDERQMFTMNPVPLIWSIIPPVLAILMALIFKEVILSLFFGLFIGAVVLNLYAEGFKGIFLGMMRTIDQYIVGAIADSGHVSIILFSMLIGAMVAIISKNGGMQGIVDKIARYANTPRNGQLVTWVLGIAIFFDDYANSLVVGNTMRPITDRLKISREKLAYIVDSTAAPIVAIAFVTTWIGAELGYIASGIESLDTLNESVYATFFNSLQYSFYPIFTLAFVLFIILQEKDFGPMHTAEVRARSTGVVSSSQTVEKLDQDDLSEFTAKSGLPARWYNAAIPVATVILGTIAGLLYTGWDTDIWQNQELSLGFKLSEIIGQADSYLALMWSSLAAVFMAMILTLMQRLLSLNEIMDSVLGGFKTMMSAIVILILAWSLAAITKDMHTADLLKQLMSDSVSPWMIPMVTFILAALVAFSTGSSWGTMAILYPLMLPTAWLVSENSGYGYEEGLAIFHNVVACVLAGSVLGDHCSPISDTTILSSLASSCHHIDHVNTQMPYALTVGGIAIGVGIVPAALGVPTWILYPIGFVLLFVIVRRLGKKSMST